MAESMSPASRTPRLDMRGPVGLACLAKPDLLHMDLDRPAAARELLYVTRCGQTVRYIAPISVYDPVHGSPSAGIKTASGAGGARTHDRRIMSPPQSVEASSSSSSQVAYRPVRTLQM